MDKPVSLVPDRRSPAPAAERLLLRPAEAAAMLGISRSRCYQLLQRGELPSFRLGGSVRVPVEDLRRMIAEQRLAGSTAA